MHESLLDKLVCPKCRGALEVDFTEVSENQITAGDLSCKNCKGSYQIRGTIGGFLTYDWDREDLWEESVGHITEYLNEHPEVRGKLVDSSPDDLEPVDRMFAAEYLEEQGRFSEAEDMREGINQHLYTAEFLQVMDECVKQLVDMIPARTNPVVDVASGRGALIKPMLERDLPCVVCSDFSPKILRRNRDRLRAQKVNESVNYLAFDARRSPFADKMVPVLTSHMGIANILEDADEALSELRRICSDSFLFTHMFFREDDSVHGPIVRESGYPFGFMDEGLQFLKNAGWDVQVIFDETVPIEPTPQSELLPDMSVDQFPITSTEVQCVLLRLR